MSAGRIDKGSILPALPKSVLQSGRQTRLRRGSAVTVAGNLILTGTSIAPVLFVYAVMALVEKEYLPSIVLTSIGLGLFLSGLLLLSHLKRNLEKSDENFTSVEAADRESIGLLVLYVLPLLRTPFSALEFTVLIPAVTIFLALAFTGFSYHFNPLLNLLGWRFYKVGTPQNVTYVLITRKKINNVARQFTVGKLTTHTVIDLEQ